MKIIRLYAIAIAALLLSATEYSTAQTSPSYDLSFGDAGHVWDSTYDADPFVLVHSERASDSTFLCHFISYLDNNHYMLRVRDNGYRDLSFNNGEVLYTNTLSPYPAASSRSNWIYQDGSILFCSFYSMQRYLPNGELDLAFGNSGSVDFSETAWSITVDGSGKILVATSDDLLYDAHVRRFLSDGSVDGSFGAGGSVLINPGYIINDLEIQGDGKILGLTQHSVEDGGLEIQSYEIFRLKPNGLMDSTFNDDGIAFIEMSSLPLIPLGILTEPDGHIVISGKEAEGGWVEPIGPRFTMARYQSNGQLDNSFGTGGLRHVALSEAHPDMELERQADGKYVTINAHNVYRFLHNGDADANFGTGGAAILNSPRNELFRGRPSIGADGKIWIGGTTLDENDVLGVFVLPSPYAPQNMLARLTADGQPDLSFAPYAYKNFGTERHHCEGGRPLMQADGSCLVLGGRDRALVTKLKVNGTPDSAYGTWGHASYTHKFNLKDFAQRQDGSVIVYGHNPGNDADIGVYTTDFWTHLLADGTLDLSYGSSGIVVDSLNALELATVRMVLRNDDYMIRSTSISAGLLPGGNIWFTPHVTRYKPQASRDSSFGLNGTKILKPYGENVVSVITAILPRPGGKILIAGRGFDESNNLFGGFVALLNADGSYDPAFAGGVPLILPPAMVREVTCLTVDDAGKILLAGTENAYASFGNLALGRLNPDGSYDPTFGDNGLFVLHDEQDGLPMTLSPQQIIAAPDNHILVLCAGGMEGDHAAMSHTLYRLKAGGRPDSSFGINGHHSFEMEIRAGMTLHPDGRLTISGLAHHPQNTHVLRLFGDGSMHADDPAQQAAGWPGQAGSVQLFPNPAADELRVRTNFPETTKATISVVDLSGRMVAILAEGHTCSKGQEVLKFPVGKLPAGHYLLQVSSTHRTESRPFVKLGE